MKCSGLFYVFFLVGCNGGINLPVGTGQAGGAPITADPGDNSNTDGTPSPTPDPGSSPAPSPSATPQPTSTPIPGLKSQIFVSKALVAVNKVNSRAEFEKVCQSEAKGAKLSGKFTALVGITDAKFTDIYQVPGAIYQKVGNDEVPVANNFEGLISGHNNAIFAAACGRRIDQNYYNLVWTGALDFHEESRSDLNCKNWGSKSGKGVVGWMGATGPEALSLKYLGCGSHARVYCIQVK